MKESEMDKAEHTLYEVPEKAQSYAESIFGLDPEDIPWERVPKLIEIMRTSPHPYDALLAARVLTDWANDEGFDFLAAYVDTPTPSGEIVMPHRLRGYDDTCTQILSAIVRYWARYADTSPEQGELARRRIRRPIEAIIRKANDEPFEIDRMFWLVSDEGFTEYLPALKEHLAAILMHPEIHHWKIADCAHLLVKIDPDYVTQVLAAQGKTLADFPNK